MADQSDRPEPDHTEDPRRQDMGDAGYAETAPEGTSPRPEDDERDPETEPHADRAPGTSAPDEGDPGQATGNPDAAGG